MVLNFHSDNDNNSKTIKITSGSGILRTIYQNSSYLFLCREKKLQSTESSNK